MDSLTTVTENSVTENSSQGTDKNQVLLAFETFYWITEFLHRIKCRRFKYIHVHLTELMEQDEVINSLAMTLQSVWENVLSKEQYITYRKFRILSFLARRSIIDVRRRHRDNVRNRNISRDFECISSTMLQWIEKLKKYIPWNMRIRGTLCETCVICLENINENGVHLITCGHPYHLSCITTWIDSSNTCPLCRNHVRDHMVCFISTSITVKLRSEET